MQDEAAWSTLMEKKTAKAKRNHWRIASYSVAWSELLRFPLQVWRLLIKYMCWDVSYICCVHMRWVYALISLVKLIVRDALFRRQCCVLHLENAKGETLLCELSYFLVCVSYFLPHERLFVIGIHWVWCCYAILLLRLHLFIDSTQHWYELRV